jgi:large subunit ribosomal protein LX
LSETKRFKITGEIRKGQTRIPFSVEYNSLKEQHALEHLYADMGSRHGARRFEIKITDIKEADVAEVQAKE